MRFDPTPEALADRLAAIDPADYARTRNFLDGAVTRLSPYLTHGFTDLPAVVASLRARFPAESLGKLVEEFAWREFFHHVWRHRGTAIVKDLGPPPWAGTYAMEMPADVLTASSGVPVIDASVRELYATGWIHNHARMWLAAYLVHVRKVHWRAGADWMYGHLLDGDLASNHLSWQWVAGTFSTKPYVFNAENVAKYAPSLASPGTVIDATYEALGQRARELPDAGPESTRPDPLEPPPLLAEAPGIRHSAVPPRFADGETVALVHPWCLAEPPAADRVLAVFHAPFHERYRWSERRFDFVATRMRAIAGEPWFGDVKALVKMNRGARFVTRATLNTGYGKAFAEPNVEARPEPRLLPDPAEPCASFSAFRKRAGPIA
jgi:deoxyribodipyrimidine photo-lyase